MSLPKKYTVNRAYWHGNNLTTKKKSQIVGAGTAKASLTASGSTLPEPAVVTVVVTDLSVKVRIVRSTAESGTGGRASVDLYPVAVNAASVLDTPTCFW